mgnify:CR=1 FL=1
MSRRPSGPGRQATGPDDSFLSVPIRYSPGSGQSRTVGVINLIGRQDGSRFSTANQKLLTGAAALALLGPDFRFETRVLGAAYPVNGILTGDLAVIGAELLALDLDERAIRLGRDVDDVHERVGQLLVEHDLAEVEVAGLQHLTQRLRVPVALRLDLGELLSGAAAVVRDLRLLGLDLRLALDLPGQRAPLVVPCAIWPGGARDR